VNKISVHAEPRFTKDLDVWIGTDTANLERAAPESRVNIATNGLSAW
jgi:hypothetical protein